jgi:hypothetical protein
MANPLPSYPEYPLIDWPNSTEDQRNFFYSHCFVVMCKRLGMKRLRPLVERTWIPDSKPGS